MKAKRSSTPAPSAPEAAAQYPGAQVLDVRGQTIMPGLIDAHVHLTMYGKPSSVMDFLMDSATYTALKAADCAKKLLYAGFTTVRSMGDKASADYAVKRAINEGMIEGPRLLTSGKAISITGGHGDFVPGTWSWTPSARPATAWMKCAAPPATG